MDTFVELRMLAIGLWLVLVVVTVVPAMLAASILERRARRRPSGSEDRPDRSPASPGAGGPADLPVGCRG